MSKISRSQQQSQSTTTDKDKDKDKCHTPPKMQAGRFDFDGVVIMADLVKSTNLSEEMEKRAAREDCGDGTSVSPNTVPPLSSSNIIPEEVNRNNNDNNKNNNPQNDDDDARRASFYDPTLANESSHSRHEMEKNESMKHALTMRSLQNDAKKLGAERLRTVLQKYFAKLIDLTMLHGGDVVRIAGDAIISVFGGDEKETIKSSLERAQTACLDILRDLNDYEIDGCRLKVRLYMVVGSLSLFCVGGYQGRWEYMISGQPFADLKVLGNMIGPGELIMSGDCWDILYSNTSR